jgi:hypothetical protein
VTKFQTDKELHAIYILSFIFLDGRWKDMDVISAIYMHMLPVDIKECDKVGKGELHNIVRTITCSIL